jgi:voltage-gated potassium channel
VVSFLDQMLRDPRTSLRVEEITVPDDSPALGKTLAFLNVNDLDGAVPLALRTQGGPVVFKPAPDTPIDRGAVLIAMVDAAGRARIEQRLHSGRLSSIGG